MALLEATVDIDDLLVVIFVIVDIVAANIVDVEALRVFTDQIIFNCGQ